MAYAVHATYGSYGERKLTVRKAARTYNISKSTISRYRQQLDVTHHITCVTLSIEQRGGIARQVFTPEQDAAMVEMIVQWWERRLSLSMHAFRTYTLRAALRLYPDDPRVLHWAERGVRPAVAAR
jgi:hypothetical protein